MTTVYYESIDKQKNVPAFVQNWLEPLFSKLYDTEDGKFLWQVYTAREFEEYECKPGIRTHMINITNEWLADIEKYITSHPRAFRMPSDPVDPMRPFIDNYAVYGVLRNWLKYKQIFKFNKDLLEGLMATEISKFSFDYIKNLPYPNMYIDISELNLGFHGAFICINDNHILKNAESHVIDIVLISKNLDSMRGMLYVDIPDNETDLKDVFNGKYYEGCDISTKLLMQLFVNCLVYLNLENRDAVATSSQKSTVSHRNKKGKKCKNTIEAKAWEVGYRTVSYKKETVTNVSDYSSDSKRHSPRPHIRCGHWHKHYVGPRDNQKIVVLWHMPTFVNCFSASELPTVEHETRR